MPHRVLDDEGNPMDAQISIEEDGFSYATRGVTRGYESVHNTKSSDGLKLVLARLVEAGFPPSEILVGAPSPEAQRLDKSARRIQQAVEVWPDVQATYSRIMSRMKEVARVSDAQEAGPNSTRGIKIRLSVNPSEKSLIELLTGVKS